MQVLVTGGAGYVGAHVVRALLRAGHGVVVVDDLSTGHRAFAERNGVPLVQGDFGCPELLEQVFALHAPEAIVHVAGKALVAESVDDPAPYFAVNVAAGLRLLEAARRHGVRRLVFSSTAAVYGVPSQQPIDERCPREPVNPYGASKLAFEHALAAYAGAYEMRVLALRYFNVAGASAEADLGELHTPETHLVPNLLRAAREGSPFRLYGTNYPTRDGTAERDFIHVEDLARAHVQALERLDIIDPLGFGCALNLGTGKGVTVREVAAAAERVLGAGIEVSERPRRPGDPPRLVADPSLARRVIGLHCAHDVDSMIRSAHRFAEAERERGGVEVVEEALKGGDVNRSPRPRRRFGEVAVQRGYLSPEQVERALAIQRERDGIGESHKLVGLILLEMGALSNEQLIETLRAMQG
ncbi:MAG: UDP-glucose 4-epimerase GalE [Planctomycetota bacterium]|nr:MAG: UDP-glucose 4-epimerase GalE [Planctomycetota bacterium]